MPSGDSRIQYVRRPTRSAARTSPRRRARRRRSSATPGSRAPRRRARRRARRTRPSPSAFVSSLSVRTMGLGQRLADWNQSSRTNSMPETRSLFVVPGLRLSATATAAAPAMTSAQPIRLTESLPRAWSAGDRACCPMTREPTPSARGLPDDLSRRADGELPLRVPREFVAPRQSAALRDDLGPELRPEATGARKPW
jgi:hypothetical protein